MGTCRKFREVTELTFTALISSFDLAIWQKSIGQRVERREERTVGGEKHANERGHVLQ